MAIESSPSGPLMCTVDMACTLALLALAEGATTWKVTPWGIESGKDPILDWHDAVEVKVLVSAGLENTGSRKVGIESLLWLEAFAKLWAHRRRAGANMLI